jgi:hypothetical protein
MMVNIKIFRRFPGCKNEFGFFIGIRFKKIISSSSGKLTCKQYIK